MILSEPHRGLIYAGETPFASSIEVAQTGPMTLTIRAGSFTTTGEAVIRRYEAAAHGALVASGKAERLAGGERVRVWLQDADGQPIDKAATSTLGADIAMPVTADPGLVTSWRAALALDPAAAVTILPQSRLGGAPWPATPAGWRVIHTLVYNFDVPPGTVTLTTVPIYVVTVRPGFPSGTGPDDWRHQSARLPVGR